MQEPRTIAHQSLIRGAFLVVLAGAAGCVVIEPRPVSQRPTSTQIAAPAPATAPGGAGAALSATGASAESSSDPILVSVPDRPERVVAPAARRWMEGAPESPNVTQVTFASEGEVFDPDLSRDGQWLVFASTQHRPTADIYLKRVDSRVVTQLTNDPAEDATPTLSPDGSRVAFSSNRAGSWDIYVMPASGGRAMQVTNDPAPELNPSWSPDGRRVVFNRFGTTSGRWEMWVSEVNDSPVTHFIGYGMMPRWSPVAGANGKDQILFQRGRERGDRAFSVWTLEYAGSQASSPTEIISNPLGALINPSWSPDGTRVVFASVPNDGSWSRTEGSKPERADLWMIDLTGNNLVKLTDGSATDLMPVWRGERVYFVSDRGGQENVWAIDIADAVRLAEGPGASGGGAVAGASEPGGGQ
jgi:TolB protein